MAEIVFFNGKFISRQEAKVSVLTPGFLYGWGVFETMRADNKKIVYFDAHLKRIKNSCRLINIRFPYGLNKFKKIIAEAVKICQEKDAYLRLSLWKSEKTTDILISVKKYQPYPAGKYKKGFSAYISSFRQNENSFLAKIKTANYLFYQLAYQEAKKKCFDEAIILNQRGYLCEGSRSNIFLVKDNSLCAPALECGCLDGITRKVIIDLAKKDKIKFYAGKFTIQDLYEADEAFLTNSLMGVMPLASVDNKLIGRGKWGKITRLFMHKYNLLLKGR